MKYLILTFFFLSACVFHPIYTNETRTSVCVAPIPNEEGYQLRQQLQQHFPNTDHCIYTLTVETPHYSFSDQSISDKDFITMQRISAVASYTLKDENKNVVLKNTVSANGSSAVTSNPYASVVASQKTSKNLTTILAEQIVLHVSAFLDEEAQ